MSSSIEFEKVGRHGDQYRQAVRSWLHTLGSVGQFTFHGVRQAVLVHARTIGLGDIEIPDESSRSLCAMLKAEGGGRVIFERKIFNIAPKEHRAKVLSKSSAQKVVAPNLDVVDKRTLASLHDKILALQKEVAKLEAENLSLKSEIHFFRGQLSLRTPSDRSNLSSVHHSASSRPSNFIGTTTSRNSTSTSFSSSSSYSSSSSSCSRSSTSSSSVLFTPAPLLPNRLKPPSPLDESIATLLHGSRAALSNRFRMAIREVYVLSGVSMVTLPRLITLALWEGVVELRKLQLLREVPGHELVLTDVVKMVPSKSTISSILDRCQEIDDYRLSEILESSLDEVFSVADGGNQGDTKLNFSKATGFNHHKGCVQNWMLSAQATTGGGPAIAHAVRTDGRRVGLHRWGGCTVDNASEMKNGFVSDMRTLFPFFVFIGCTLHILNLVLMNAYFTAYGKDEIGKCSALRVAFMLHYLQQKFKAEWVQWCKANPEHADIAFLAAGGAATRWWSIMLSFTDVYRGRVAYSAWCFHMHDGLHPTSSFRGCLKELGSWLLNPKVIADIALNIDFTVEWWNPEMTWHQGIGPWQLHLNALEYKGGFC